MTGGGLSGGLIGYCYYKEKYSRIYQKDIPTKILIVPTLTGTIAGTICCPISLSIMGCILFQSSSTYYKEWVKNVMENPHS